MDNLGGGIALAVAAALWMLYLVPSWLRRNEYLHTERNAVRLQQSLRVMAETAAAPGELSVELSDRGVSEQRRAASRLAAEQAAASAQSASAQSGLVRADAPMPARSAVAAQYASPARPGSPQSGVRSGAGLAAVRLRRSRLATTVLLAVAAVVLISTLVPAFSGAPIAWGAFAASAVVVTASFGMLTAMARVSRRRRSSYREAMRRPSQAFIDHAPAAPLAAGSRQDRAWTPTPLPRPLYAEHARAEQLRRAQQQAEQLRVEIARQSADSGYGYGLEDAAAGLELDADLELELEDAAPASAAPAPRSAAAVAQQLQRESEQATERLRAAGRAVPAVDGASPAAKAPETRYARMGVIEEPPSSGLADLDAVFRRRAVG